MAKPSKPLPPPRRKVNFSFFLFFGTNETQKKRRLHNCLLKTLLFLLLTFVFKKVCTSMLWAKNIFLFQNYELFPTSSASTLGMEWI